MPRTETSALLLTGPVGSGKTAAAAAAAELLAERGAAYAAVDLDWLAWAGGVAASPAELLTANLAAVWRNLRAAGVERLVLARHVRSPDEVDAIRAALAGATLAVVRLELPRAELEARVRARDEGAELAEHLALIAEDAAAARFEDARVEAAGLRPAEVARAALAAAGWL